MEKLLQYEFKDFNVKYDAGTEFYNRSIIDLIEPYFIKIGIIYKKLSKDEINYLIRPNRIKRTFEKINIKSLIENLKSNSYIPREDQKIIIEKSVNYFQQFDKGLLILVCGIGKTLISLWIMQKLESNTIIIGVPNKLLLKQWAEVVEILFNNKLPYLIISSGITNEKILSFIEINKNKLIIITTYASAHKIKKITSQLKFIFDIKINDECHHLTSSNLQLTQTTKQYIQMLNIQSIKQLSLTATLKLLENDDNDNDKIISNDNVKYFGEIIDRKCLLWGIENKIICDYVIQTIITDDNDFKEDQFNFDKRLFLSAFASLKSIYDNNSHHLLIYANNKENSLKLIEYIEQLLNERYFNIPNLYYSNYHSEMKSKKQKEIIEKFEKAKFGIISCVYCLGEGWNFPLLDGVLFAENMTSNIRIVQSALRASRKNKSEPNKITKIILPILNNDNLDLKKVKDVIYQMGLEDETISQKIRVLTIKIEKQKENDKKDDIKKFGEYNEELTQKLRLQTIKRTALDITYQKAIKIISEKNIKNKEEYYKLCEFDNRLSIEPEIVFNGQFTNWIDYLSIKRIYYDFKTCKNKVNEYLLSYPEIKIRYLNLSIICNELCKIDVLFPPFGLWTDYYDVKSLHDIIIIENKRKHKGVIL